MLTADPPLLMIIPVGKGASFFLSFFQGNFYNSLLNCTQTQMSCRTGQVSNSAELPSPGRAFFIVLQCSEEKSLLMFTNC